MHIQETRHAKHKTRLDKTPRRGMRRHTNIRQTHSKTSTTRQAQQDTHNKTQARMGYTGGHGVCPPGVSTHGISPKNGFPPSHGAGSGRLQGGGGGGRGRGGGGGDTPAPSQLESQWESQELPNQLQDPLLRASHGANTGSVVMLCRGSVDRTGAGRGDRPAVVALPALGTPRIRPAHLFWVSSTGARRG